jgi:hypothetical protein
LTKLVTRNNRVRTKAPTRSPSQLALLETGIS